MTDKEIIKALECCSKSGWLNDCDGCPCYDEKEDIQTSECQERIMKNALDLINRKDAEIEKLERTVSHLEDYANGIADKVKAEVIKEFAERLKIAFIDTPMNYYDIENTITNLVKEMVGEGK